MKIDHIALYVNELEEVKTFFCPLLRGGFQ